MPKGKGRGRGRGKGQPSAQSVPGAAAQPNPPVCQNPYQPPPGFRTPPTFPDFPNVQQPPPGYQALPPTAPNEQTARQPPPGFKNLKTSSGPDNREQPVLPVRAQAAPPYQEQPATRHQEQPAPSREKPPAAQAPALKIPHLQGMPSVSNPFPKQRYGTLGRKIALQANHFAVDIPQGSVFHYDMEIQRMKNGKIIKPKNNGPPTKRNFNAELCRRIFDQLANHCRNTLFNQILPAYDGNKNIITRRPLPINCATNIIVKILENGLESEFNVIIKPVQKDWYNCEISLEPLHEALQGRTTSVPQECIMALDIVFRHGPSFKYVPVGRSFFERPQYNEDNLLGEGKEIWFGFHQSLRPGWKPLPNSTRYYLNVDKSATAFLTAQPVLDFMCDVLHLYQRNGEKAFPNFLADYQIKTLKNRLFKVKVQVTHQKYPRKYVVTGVSRDRASAITFKMDGEDVSVPEYFLRAYNYKLQYPNYPCITAGNDKKVFLPLEVCNIVAGQTCQGRLEPDEQAIMVKKTVIPPIKRLNECKRSVRKIMDASAQMNKEFDIRIDPEPLKLDGRVLTAPKVLYKGENNATVKDGQWEMRGKQFLTGSGIESWIMVSFCRCEERDMMMFARKLIKSAGEAGMMMRDTRDSPKLFPNVREESGILQLLSDLKKRFNLQLAVVVLTKNSNLYKTVKKVCETDLGLITQCVTDQNMTKCNDERFSFRFLMNLCQKINGKLGGVNTSLIKEEKPEIFRRPCMIIGADVTHPAPTDKEKYSIAAAVGSMDSFPAKYIAAVQLQKEAGVVRAREETILNLKVMIKTLLQDFVKRTRGNIPETIIYYRDGVSEGQFQTVRDAELIQIRQACSEIHPNYEPKITFIVVQKRHHTRFFPQNFDDEGVGRPKNVPPGTTVDTDITSPSHFNFYLCSHLAIQGTSRPGHYNVLYDDSDFDANTLQKLTFYLCHTYARCTKSISIPPPVMYADLAAYRAKVYIDQLKYGRESSGSGSSNSDGSNSSIISEEIVNAILLKEEIREKMYFL